MRKFGTAMGALALAAGLSACSYPGSDASKSASIFGGKVDEKNVGVATRAQAALVAGDVDTAIALAERAVENSPTDAGFRALLGNAYFAAGRHNSADQAYRDSLRLVPVQPKIALKRALVLVAQGRNEAAAMMLNGARDMLDPADRGLGLALAGRTDEAVRVLDDAARQPGADGRIRQNLALAHGFNGDWQTARLIASQDVPAHLIDVRLQQWMVMAKAEHPSTKVASLLGVREAVQDAGMPVRLALAEDDGNRFAQIEQPPIAAEAPVPYVPATSAPVVAASMPATSYAPAPAPRFDATPVATDIQIADIELAEVDADEADAEDALAPLAGSSKPSAMAPVAMAQASAARAEAPKPAFSASSTRLTQSARSIRTEAERTAKASRSVVQVAAYMKRDRLDIGWDRATNGYGALKGYAPMAARTKVDGQTFYRLAAHGFASDAEARDFCMELKASGGQCWVRRMAGDTPFRLASKD